MESSIRETTGPLGSVRAELVARGAAATGDFVLQRVTIPSRGQTTWHRHEGQQFVIVGAGVVIRDSVRCDQIKARAGEAFIEEPGDVHIGRNPGAEPTVLWVLCVVSRGSQVAIPIGPMELEKLRRPASNQP